MRRSGCGLRVALRLRVACYVLRVAGCGLRGARCGSFDLGYGIADFGLERRRTEALEFGIGNAEIGMKGGMVYWVTN